MGARSRPPRAGFGARLTLAAAPCPSWRVDRQQGKTTSLSKIIAALMLGSPAGGNLVFVYSASLRASPVRLPLFSSVSGGAAGC